MKKVLITGAGSGFGPPPGDARERQSRKRLRKAHIGDDRPDWLEV